MLISHIFPYLAEAPIPSSYEAGLKRFGMDNPKQKTEFIDSNKLVKQLQQMIEKGDLNQETIKNFKTMNSLLDKILGSKQEGGRQVERPTEKSTERPTYSSWYGKRQQSSEKPTEGQEHRRTVKLWGERLSKLVATNPKYRKPIQNMLIKAVQAKKGRLKEQLEPESGGPTDLMNRFQNFVKNASIKELYQISDMVQQAIRDPKSMQDKKPNRLGHSRTGVARNLRQQKLKQQNVGARQAPQSDWRTKSRTKRNQQGFDQDAVKKNMRRSIGF